MKILDPDLDLYPDPEWYLNKMLDPDSINPDTQHS